MSNPQHVHRPTGSKQINKNHKGGKHFTKGAIKKKNQGKVAPEVHVGVKDTSASASKVNRRNHAKQVRSNRKDAVVMAKRVGHDGLSPKVVGIIGIGEGISLDDATQAILDACEIRTRHSATSATVVLPAWKQRVTLIRAPEDLNGILDLCKVADVLLCVVSGQGLSARGERVVSSIKAQGLPTVIGVMQGLKNITNAKLQKQARKDLAQEFETRFADDTRAVALDGPQDVTQLIRFMANTRLRAVPWRDARPYVLADRVSFAPTDAANPQSAGTLAVSGYLRGGRPLSVNGLVHIPDFGDFQLKQVDEMSDPNPLNVRRDSSRSRKASDASQMDLVPETEGPAVTVDRIVLPNPAVQETLDSENVPDPMAGEQTWPTEDELADADERMAKIQGQKRKKKVPKGFSAYQAAWIPEDEEDGDGEDDDEDDEDASEGEDEADAAMDDTADPDPGSRAAADQPPPAEPTEAEDDDEEEEWDYLEEGQESKAGSRKGTGPDDTEMADAAAAGPSKEELRRKRQAESEEDVKFPDEVDTPEDQPARIRFQRYRGLKSFRSTPWDPQESLPAEYARIFQFESFARAKKRVLSTDGTGSTSDIHPGQYVTLHIANVPAAIVAAYSDLTRPPVIGGLPKYENQVPLLHFHVPKQASYEAPVRSKETLVFHCGFRRFETQPIFSENNFNSDKHRLERFLHARRSCVASAYAPIMFPPSPVLIYKQENGVQQLVATGTLRGPEPDRIIVKKIVLTGIPARVFKRYVIVRDMFYNPGDVTWFKPIEVWTKHGRTGHIKESLGTHGLMKCVFDSMVQQNDTVCMSLYKRVYPRWCPFWSNPSGLFIESPAVPPTQSELNVTAGTSAASSAVETVQVNELD
eukprot:TRINITY_DN9827_c0_g1_i1.p1 TRINITY_DN9827_c0_g1~~TRINITY_DN9827_c0_g1_i1.p1  ORF type:complete len:868 (+),score=304.71 TRINITY_DN9827_c0_g1_i1:66-2669(+)